MPNMACINGRFMPLRKARVPVEDRGYQFGDGVYELIRTYNGRLFHLEAHLDRLSQSATAVGLDLVYSRSRWMGMIKKLFERSGYKEAKIYIQITRGVAAREHAFPKRSRPTVVMTVRRFVPPPAVAYRRGGRVVTVPDIRWGRCDIKSINLLPNVMARQKARTAGVSEAVFVRDGLVTEGSSSNVFTISGGRLVTPARGSMILPGITREIVLQLAKDLGLPVTEGEIPLSMLLASDEVFLTGTTIEILPVVRVDGRPVGDGRPGRITQLLYQRFRAVVRN